MPRRMSCSLTVDQVLDRSKTVTRRRADTWRTIRPGDGLVLVEKAMGLPKGATQVVLDRVTVVDVRLEPLHLMSDTEYGWAETAREGFPDMHPDDFVSMWLESHGDPTFPDQDAFMAYQVRRIEWAYPAPRAN